VTWESEFEALRAEVDAIRERLQGTEAIIPPVVPTIMEFVLSPEYLAKPTLFPRQGLELKVTWLETESLTSYDLKVLRELGTAFVPGAYDELFEGRWFEPAPDREYTSGTTPDVLDRMAILKSRGRRSFRQVISAKGRRAGKGEIASINASYLIWQLLALGDPQPFVNAAPGKMLSIDCYAGNQQQAREAVFGDIVRAITRAPCFHPFIESLRRDRLTLATPGDLAAGRPGSIEVVARETTTLAARGQTTVCAIFDEMAHIDPANSKISADDLYAAATPALDQARGRALIMATSSPAQRAGKFYALFRQACEIDEDTGQTLYPDMVAFQASSWDPYLDADIATELPLVSEEAAGDGWLRTPEGAVRGFPDPGGPPVIYDEELRQKERQDPVRFMVENGGQWADVLNPLLYRPWITRMFEEPDGVVLDPNSEPILALNYRIHIDPSSRWDPAVYVIAHEVTILDVRYLVVDRIRRFLPVDGELDLAALYKELERDIRAFAPTSVTVDQHGGAFLLESIKERLRDFLRGNRVNFDVAPHSRNKNLELTDRFRDAMQHGRVRSPYNQQLELELRFLQDVNGSAKAPTSGPCTTDDVAVTLMVLTHQILGHRDYGQDLRAVGLRGHPGLSKHPLAEDFSAFGASRRRRNGGRRFRRR
jgi:hypothetical protein